MSTAFLPWAAAAAFSWLTLRVLLSSGLAARALDHPNSRSLHSVPVPRLGGLGFLPPVAFALWHGQAGPLAGALLFLAALSFVDDLRGLPSALRFLCHALAATSVAWSLGGAALPWPGLLLTVLAMVWMTNLYNFMDGADGLAGGMALIGFFFLALPFAVDGRADGTTYATTALAASGAALGFLCFNWRPARLFMGDVGSIPLGFLAATLSLAGATMGVFPPWYGPAVFAPFVADASLTLCKRIWRREKIWQAHRNHYYQRLIRFGPGHGRVIPVYYALMALSGGLALAAWQRPTAAPWILLPGLFGLLLLALLTDRRLTDGGQ